MKGKESKRQERNGEQDQACEGEERERERAEGMEQKRGTTADWTIQSSQEATKGQQRADQIIQFIWIGERASE